MNSGEASRLLGWVLIQIYEKEGKISSVRDERNWRVYDGDQVKALRDRLLDILQEPTDSTTTAKRP